MNTTHAKAAKITAALLASLCLIGFATSAQSAESRLNPIQVQGSQMQGALEVACDSPRVPGQQEIARLFEIENFSQTYDLRNRLQHVVTRACHSGADRVRFVFDQNAAEGTLRYVARND